MKFGLYLLNFGPYGDPRVLANLAQDAENAGWDGFFIWDHIETHAEEKGCFKQMNKTQNIVY